MVRKSKVFENHVLMERKYYQMSGLFLKIVTAHTESHLIVSDNLSLQYVPACCW